MTYRSGHTEQIGRQSVTLHQMAAIAMTGHSDQRERASFYVSGISLSPWTGSDLSIEKISER